MWALRTFFILLVFSGLFACQNANSSKNNKPPKKTGLIKTKGNRFYGGTFKFNETNIFRTLEPHKVIDLSGIRIANQIFEGLLKYDPKNLSVLPCLAKSWEKDETGQVYIFHLRTDVFFHEDDCFGSEKTRKLNAKDVNYCFTKLCEPSAGNSGFYLFVDIIKGASDYYRNIKKGGASTEGIEGLKVVNDSTIEITVTTPTLDFPKLLATQGAWIFPKEAKEFYQDDFQYNLIGTGPFTLAEYIRDSTLILKRNHLYWDYDEFGNQKPFLSTIDVSFERNKRKEIIAFREGKLDLVWSVPVDLINDMMGNIEEAKRGENIPYKINSTPLMQVDYYGFNYQAPPFNNKLVRQAISMAIDKEQLNIFYLKGDGIAANYGFIPTSLPRYPFHKIKSTSFNPAKAKKLLEKAGYNKNNKFPPITLQYDYAEKNQIAAKEIKRMLEENLGIEVKLNELSHTEHYRAIEADKASFWRAAWIADYPSPHSFLIQFFSGSNNHSPDIASIYSPNLCNYNNPVFDSIYSSCLKIEDHKERLDCFASADQLLMDDAAVIPMTYAENISLLSLDIQNFETTSLGGWDFSEVYMIPINPEAKNPLLE